MVNFTSNTSQMNREILTFQDNNSDYLQKARKYGHFTGYKN